jgi:hypothetical protein
VWWWEKLLGCGWGDGWWLYLDNEHSFLKENVRFLTILKTMFPVRENANVVLLEMKTLTNYAGIGFRILFIKYFYLFICMFYLNHIILR